MHAKKSDYLENFYYIQEIPLVKKLIKENAKLKKKNKNLKKLVKMSRNNV